MVLFFCLTTLQNWQNCPAALTNHSGFLSIQLGFFRTSRGGANIPAQFIADAGISIELHLSYILTIFSLKWYSGHASFSNWSRREVAACPFCSMFRGEFWRILFPGKFWGFQKSAVKKSSNTQKHRELQLTVFLGFQAACVLSGIFWADKPFWRGF